MVPLSQPATKQCFTPATFTHRCASTHFGENQLALGSIGISPLTTPPPPIFQHWSVRTSTTCYGRFILDMVRSPGFGSTNSDYWPSSDSVSLWLRLFVLTEPLPVSRRLILQQAHGHPFYRTPIACKLRVSCSFHSPFGVLFTFPSRYFPLSVTQ